MISRPSGHSVIFTFWTKIKLVPKSCHLYLCVTSRTTRIFMMILLQFVFFSSFPFQAPSWKELMNKIKRLQPQFQSPNKGIACKCMCSEIYNSFCSYEDNAKDLNEKLKCVLIATNDSDFNVQTRYLLTIWQNTVLLNTNTIWYILRRLNHSVQVGEPFETT